MKPQQQNAGHAFVNKNYVLENCATTQKAP